MDTPASPSSCAADSDRNPFLSASVYGITHVNPAQSDTIPYGPSLSGSAAINPARQPIVYGGPVNIMTLASTSEDYMWAVGSDHVAYISKRGGDWTQVARYEAPAYLADGLGSVSAATQQAFGEFCPNTYGLTGQADAITRMDGLLCDYYGKNYAARIKNGGYCICDRDNVLYATFGNGVYAFEVLPYQKPGSDESALRIQMCRSLADLSILVPPAEHLTPRVFGLSLTFDDRLIIVFNGGLCVINADLDPASACFLGFGRERISNSVAVEPGRTEGSSYIYVATSKTMRKLVWTGTVLSENEADGAWQCEYKTALEKAPVVKFDTGTGSTPTLMGFGENEDHLVVITDGQRHMHLVAFWRDSLPGHTSERIADEIEVTCGFHHLPRWKWIQSEQSVVAYGYDAFVVNNIPFDSDALEHVADNKLLVVALMGPAYPSPRGVEKFTWDVRAKRWESQWTRTDICSNSMVPIFSEPANMVFVNGYYSDTGWEVTGLDWESGETVYQIFFGHQNYGNGAYAILQFLENGDLLFDSIVGPMRVTAAPGDAIVPHHFGDPRI